MFSTGQKADLEAKLSRDAVKTRSQGGRSLSYIEGWHVIAEANRIFGFDGWSRETVSFNCVTEKERQIGESKVAGWGVTYVAMVRISCFGVEPGGVWVIREGCGAGHGIDRDLGLAHESALKEAETDAMKRALMSFGNQFGLALYDKEQANVADESDTSRLHFIEETKASIERISKHPDPNDLLRWWNSENEKQKRRDYDLTPAEVIMLKGLVTAKLPPPKTQAMETDDKAR